MLVLFATKEILTVSFKTQVISIFALYNIDFFLLLPTAVVSTLAAKLLI